MQRDPKAYLADMLKAVTTIQMFTVGRTFDEFEKDELLKSAVYWQFVVIGEAMAQLRKLDEAFADQITEAWRIVGFRNQIIHGYHVIRDAVTWQVIQDNLPLLRTELEELLA